jgi:hypothetical protein
MDISLQNITLGQWIDYTNALQPFEKELQEINALQSYRKPVLLTGHHVKLAYFTLDFFGYDKMPIDDAMQWYDKFLKIFEDVTCDMCVGNIIWTCPRPEILPTNALTFGEFIDAKMIVQSMAERNKWELLQYICAIFLRPEGEQYNPLHMEEDSERFKTMAYMPMSVAMEVSRFYEALNEYANSNFTIFQEADGDDSSGHMRQHMQRWGWVNFLKAMAKTKVFDIPGGGKNSIECVRLANCCEVLTWASEDKDFNLAQSADMEERINK